MPPSEPVSDLRPIPAVAVVGNDAVLAAAPATPVQIAHACLRRGFTVAVPASWGDELVAAETLRRLAPREKGPAVMCVCPYVRSRLLGPGPDLAPFLVSLVPPPVAVARYLRSVYGEHGVHITYIGACPGADDPAIDACLTPDAFLADLADHGIALSEQPLVFDSVVPPDRRRWCSLPGGVPNAEVLWHDTDSRTLVEIDRDDIATDLAQHIIARDHVLLDLAPSLGCACSGAIGPVAPHGARVAVTAAEPPRALGPVIDPAVVVALDMPVPGPPFAGAPNATSRRERFTAEPPEPPLPPESTDPQDSPAPREPESREAPPAEASVEVRVVQTTIDLIVEPSEPSSPSITSAPADATHRRDAPVGDEWAGGDAPPTLEGAAAPSADERGVAASDVNVEPVAATPPFPTEQTTPADTRSSSEGDAGDDRTTAASSPRRRTPTSIPVRPHAAHIPRAVDSEGRPLPRAYVAKRRTPPAAMPSLSTPAGESAGPELAAEPKPSATALHASVPYGDAAPAVVAVAHAPVLAAPEPLPDVIAANEAAAAEPPATPSSAPAPAPPSGSATDAVSRRPPVERSVPATTPPRFESESARASDPASAPAAATTTGHGALTLLLVTALLTLAVLVLLNLRG